MKFTNNFQTAGADRESATAVQHNSVATGIGFRLHAVHAG